MSGTGHDHDPLHQVPMNELPDEEHEVHGPRSPVRNNWGDFPPRAPADAGAVRRAVAPYVDSPRGPAGGSSHPVPVHPRSGQATPPGHPAPRIRLSPVPHPTLPLPVLGDSLPRMPPPRLPVSPSVGTAADILRASQTYVQQQLTNAGRRPPTPPPGRPVFQEVHRPAPPPLPGSDIITPGGFRIPGTQITVKPLVGAPEALTTADGRPLGPENIGPGSDAH